MQQAVFIFCREHTLMPVNCVPCEVDISSVLDVMVSRKRDALYLGV